MTFLQKLQKYYQKLQKVIINSQYATMNIGIINGGRSTNIVPDNCEVSIDFRTINNKQNLEIIKKVRKLLCSNDNLQIINNIRPFTNSYEKITMSDYITEASFLKTSKRYILGVGPINAHKKDEFITIESLEKLENQYVKIINEKCSD